ncbi:hypothetical protein ACFE04_015716 [Oxalis oulophora]
MLPYLVSVSQMFLVGGGANATAQVLIVGCDDVLMSLDGSDKTALVSLDDGTSKMFLVGGGANATAQVLIVGCDDVLMSLDGSDKTALVSLDDGTSKVLVGVLLISEYGGTSTTSVSAGPSTFTNNISPPELTEVPVQLTTPLRCISSITSNDSAARTSSRPSNSSITGTTSTSTNNISQPQLFEVPVQLSSPLRCMRRLRCKQSVGTRSSGNVTSSITDKASTSRVSISQTPLSAIPQVSSLDLALQEDDEPTVDDDSFVRDEQIPGNLNHPGLDHLEFISDEEEVETMEPIFLSEDETFEDDQDLILPSDSD